MENFVHCTNKNNNKAPRGATWLPQLTSNLKEAEQPALIKCADCGADVSDRAPTCPRCGGPIEREIVTTQQTGKSYKGMQLIGVLLILGGVVSCMAATSATPQSDDGMAFSGLLFLGGLGFYFAGRIGAWWNHG